MGTKYQLPKKDCNKLERKAFWDKFFIDQIASGLSAKKFCKLHQLPYSTYKGNKYRPEYCMPKLKTNLDGISVANRISSTPHNDCIAKFLPLQITTSGAVSQDRRPAVVGCNTTSEIQIVFKNGHRLILPSTMSELQLFSIINVVAGLIC